MKKVVLLLIIILLLILIAINKGYAYETVDETSRPATISEAYIPSEDTENSAFISFYFDLSGLAEQANFLKQNTKKIAERAVYEAKMNQRYKKYPVATTCWRIMKSYGWSDAVCAGIIGNMMAEVGGHTLNLKWDTYSHGYYGLCQWSLQFYTGPQNASIQQQMNYMHGDIKTQFDNFGFNYYRGFNYNAFLQLSSPQEAALAFAKCYERCTSASYQVRQTDALIAYNFFVG